MGLSIPVILVITLRGGRTRSILSLFMAALEVLGQELCRAVRALEEMIPLVISGEAAAIS